MDRTESPIQAQGVLLRTHGSFAITTPARAPEVQRYPVQLLCSERDSHRCDQAL